MPANQSLGVRATRRLDTAIREISVATGTVILTPIDGAPITVTAGEDKVFDPPQSGLVAYAPSGARFHLTYETDPVGYEHSRRQPGTKRQPRKRSAPSKASRGDRHSRASSASRAKGSKSSGAKPKPKSKAKKPSTRKRG